MRCLYCGNELALLKRLSGAGEFCSEAHRKKYQEEFNELALSRLLQAKPSPSGIGRGPANGDMSLDDEALDRHLSALDGPLTTESADAGLAEHALLPVSAAAGSVSVSTATPARAASANSDLPPGVPPTLSAYHVEAITPAVAPRIRVMSEVLPEDWRTTAQLPASSPSPDPITTAVASEPNDSANRDPELDDRLLRWDPPQVASNSSPETRHTKIEARDFSRDPDRPSLNALWPSSLSTSAASSSAASSAFSAVTTPFVASSWAPPSTDALDVAMPIARLANLEPWSAAPSPFSAQVRMLGELARLDFAPEGWHRKPPRPAAVPAAAEARESLKSVAGEASMDAAGVVEEPTVGLVVESSAPLEATPLDVTPEDAAALETPGELPSESQDAAVEETPRSSGRRSARQFLSKGPVITPGSITPGLITPGPVAPEPVSSDTVSSDVLSPDLAASDLGTIDSGTSHSGISASGTPTMDALVEAEPAERPLEVRGRVDQQLPFEITSSAPSAAEPADGFGPLLSVLEPEIPAAGSAPLRPVMFLGTKPAPAAQTEEVAKVAASAEAETRASAEANALVAATPHPASEPNSAAPMTEAKGAEPVPVEPAAERPMVGRIIERLPAAAPVVAEKPEKVDPPPASNDAPPSAPISQTAQLLRQGADPPPASLAGGNASKDGGATASRPEGMRTPKRGRHVAREPRKVAPLPSPHSRSFVPEPELQPMLADSPEEAVPAKAEAVEQPMAPKQENPTLSLQNRPQNRPRPELMPQPDDLDLGLPSLRLGQQPEGFWARMPVAAKIGLAVVVVAAVSGVAYLVLNGNGASAKQPAPPVQASAGYEVGLPLPTTGWIEDWAKDVKGGPRINLLRESLNMSHYRVEFTAQIEKKAIGWIFHGINPRNYYVEKLEITRQAIEPDVDVVHFAVIDGKEEAKTRKRLPMKVRVDTSYKIRFEVVNGQFTTWVLGEKVDEWKDPRLGSGGFGLMSESGETAVILKAATVTPLVPKN